MQHLALSHPDVSFKFIKDGTETLHTPGDGKLDSAIYAALGRDFARARWRWRAGETGSPCPVLSQSPLMGRGSRSMQTFFVNGRYIKSQLLTAALEEGYRNQIMKGSSRVRAVGDAAGDGGGRERPPRQDPVKFARGAEEVFDAVYHTVMDGLDARGCPGPPPKAAEQVVNPRQDFFQSMDAGPSGKKPPLPPTGRRLRQSPRAPALRGTRNSGQRPGWRTVFRSVQPMGPCRAHPGKGLLCPEPRRPRRAGGVFSGARAAPRRR